MGWLGCLTQQQATKRPCLQVEDKVSLCPLTSTLYAYTEMRVHTHTSKKYKKHHSKHQWCGGKEWGGSVDSHGLSCVRASALLLFYTPGPVYGSGATEGGPTPHTSCLMGMLGAYAVTQVLVGPSLLRNKV